MAQYSTSYLGEMYPFIKQLDSWLNTSSDIALARVTKTWGSSPRPVGSIMLVHGNGSIVGSVSGGCVEGEVAKKAHEVIETQQAALLSFGVSNEEAWSVGLSCGGQVEVFVEHISRRQSPVWQVLVKSLLQNESAVLISSILNGTTTSTLLTETGTLVGADVTESLLNEAKQAHRQRVHKRVEVGGHQYFIQVFARKPQLLVVGAAHVSVDLVALANQFGFDTVVIDPRSYFVEHIVFADPPAQLVQAYPSKVLHSFKLDADCFAAVLSHDPKIDDDALKILLPSNAAYIGALGSRKTHEKRVARLTHDGIDPELIQKIHAPIGLNIHAKTAQEIALSIMAQIVATKNAKE